MKVNEAELVRLEGTEKQVKWAESIRAQYLKEIEQLMISMRETANRGVSLGKISQAQVDSEITVISGGIDKLRTEKSSKFWIDSQAKTGKMLLQQAVVVK